MDDDGLGIWGLIGGAILGIAAAAAIIFVAKIAYDAIRDYMSDAKKIPGAATCELVKENLTSGKYRVVANVLNKSGKQLDSKAWEGEKIDDRLRAEFGQKNKIVYDLTA